jgi:hypothetical protein
VLSFNYEGLYEFNSSLVFENGKRIEINSENSIRIEDWTEMQILPKKKVKEKIIIDGDWLDDDLESSENAERYLLTKEILVRSILIWHGVPQTLPFIYQFNFEVENTGFSQKLFENLHDKNLPYFIRAVAASLWFSTSSLMHSAIVPFLEEIKKNLTKTFEGINALKPYLKKVSPIKDLRFNENYNISSLENNGYFVSNLFIEFLIDENWYPFSSLSDGTKRLFYIIAEVAYESRYYFTADGMALREPDSVHKIILIEEPELGIHPHQLHELMLFLKEQSRHKQIIITTHSPEVLDILDKDELGNVIIASYEKGEGTKLRHLDEAEIAKAQKYMEEDYLSDYWRFSDLEKEKK